MPTQRKRIGYLPRAEVQFILDNICKDNKFSQSKVTGILLEEALFTMGILKNRSYHNSQLINPLFENPFLNKEDLDNISHITPTKIDPKEEIKMIKDFIEYKFFKGVMSRNCDNNS